MQIIIEVENPNVLNRLIDLLKKSELLGGLRIWKKTNEQAKKELVNDFGLMPPEDPSPIDYTEFIGIFKPQLGNDEIDRLIAEMRED